MSDKKKEIYDYYFFHLRVHPRAKHVIQKQRKGTRYNQDESSKREMRKSTMPKKKKKKRLKDYDVGERAAITF